MVGARGRHLRSWLAWRYDMKSMHHARSTLRALEREDGVRLPDRIRRRADAYAADVLGSRRFAPWLYVYAKVRGTWSDGWIPPGYIGRVVAPNLNHVFKRLAPQKTFTRTVFPDAPVPDVAYLLDGHFFDASYAPVDMARTSSLLFDASETVILKRDASANSAGVDLLHRSTFDARRTAERFPNAVLQRRLRHHPVFDTLGGGHGAVIRVTTCRTPRGDVEARATYLQLPLPGEPFVRFGANARVAIDPSTGELHPRGFVGGISRRDRAHENAPRFEGHRVPGFGEAVALCEAAHRSRPHVGVIGWDVLIDADERSWIVEWNADDPGALVSESWAGPCFRDLGWEALEPVSGTFHV